MNVRSVLCLCAIVWVGQSGVALASEQGKKSLPKLFIDAVAKANEATVRVRVDNKDAALGVVVDKDGYIITKGSELKSNPNAVSVRLRDGSEYEASYVGYHVDTDLALLKIETRNLAVLPKFTPAKDAIVSSFVAAPGMESEPVAVGIVSAGVRKLYQEEMLIENGNKGYLGIRVGAQPDGTEAEEGVIIGFVEPGAAAARAKLKVGDRIIKIAGFDIKKFEDLRKILDDYKPGDVVKVIIDREMEEKEINVKLGSKSDFDRGDFQNKMGSVLSSRRTGFPSVIMHDMVLKPSDCGGPLVDLSGHILGLNIARAGRVETWTLPAEELNKIIPELKAGKYPPPTAVKTQKIVDK